MTSLVKQLLRSRESASPVEALKTYLNSWSADDERARGVFHPSQISGMFCPRRWCFSEMEPVENLPLPYNLRLTFDIGHVVHMLLQFYLGDAGYLYGQYVCRMCGATVVGFKPAEPCPACGAEEPLNLGMNAINSRVWWYKEIDVRNDELLITGHLDSILVINNEKYIGEFKSINDRGYSNLIGPLDSHKEQGMLYLWCLDQDKEGRIFTANRVFNTFPAFYSAAQERILEVENLPYKGVFVVYFNKNDQKKLRDFFIPNDIKVTQFIDRKRMEILPALKWKRHSGPLPERICESKADARQRKCDYVELCFKKE